MTEPPRFFPIASMSPDLNFKAAIPIKKGVAAIISPGLLHPTLRGISNAFENRLSAFQGPGLNYHRWPVGRRMRTPMPQSRLPAHSPL